MPLVYIPDSTYAPTPAFGHANHYPIGSPFDSVYTRQHIQQPSHLAPNHELGLHHPHARQTASFDPVEGHKQRLIAEYAQQLEQAFPSHHQARQPAVHQRPAEPSAYELERIRYLEAQLAEHKLRKQLEAERAQLVEARKEEQRREYEQAILRQRQQQEQQLREARLQQQHRLAQQQQLRQAAIEQEQHRRQIAYQHAHQQQQHQRRLEQHQRHSHPQHPLAGLEQLLGLFGGCEPAEEKTQPTRPTTPAAAVPKQPQSTEDEHAGGIESFFAQFAKALDHGHASPPTTPAPVTRPTSSSASSSRSASPDKINKALPPSPLTTLRALHTQFVGLTTAEETSLHLAHQLEQILLKADGVEAEGNELVRTERKKLVREVEAAIEGLEKKDKIEQPAATDATANATTATSPEDEATAPKTTEAEPASAESINAAEVSPPAEATPIVEYKSTMVDSASANSDLSPDPQPISNASPIAPSPAVPSTPAPTAEDDADSDARSDTSSIASLSGSDAGSDSGFSSDSGSISGAPKKTRKGRKAPSVEDLEAEEERYEFV